MQLGIIGLGKMGYSLAVKLHELGYDVVGYNRSEESVYKLIKEGIEGAFSISELSEKLEDSKRLFWVMVSYDAVDSVLAELKKYLRKDDLVIDGGNSFYKDSVRRHGDLKSIGVNFLDVGVSGGPHGVLEGCAYVIGGDEDIFYDVQDLFNDLAHENGYGYLGKSGAGHFAKMVHNGIEYGMIQSIAEGFDLLKSSEYLFDLTAVAQVYSNGSVISSKLTNYLKSAYEKYGSDLNDVTGSASESGEGRWAVSTAKDLQVEAKVLESALDARIKSQKAPNYQGKVVSALRGEFGGHEIVSKHMDTNDNQ